MQTRFWGEYVRPTRSRTSANRATSVAARVHQRQPRRAATGFRSAASRRRADVNGDAAGAQSEQGDRNRQKGEVVVHRDREDARQRQLGHQQRGLRREDAGHDAASPEDGGAARRGHHVSAVYLRRRSKYPERGRSATAERSRDVASRGGGNLTPRHIRVQCSESRSGESKSQHQLTLGALRCACRRPR